MSQVIRDIWKALIVSTGATLIGWIQAGTGAIQRTVFDKLRDTKTFRDFGAVGDGTTDDTAAITAALSSGFPIVDHGATYRLTAAIVVTGGAFGLSLHGAGSNCTKLVWDGAGGISYTNTAVGALKYGQFPRTRLQGFSLITKGANAGVAVSITQNKNFEPGVTIDDVFISGQDTATQYWTKGIVMTDVVGSRLRNVWINGVPDTVSQAEGIRITQTAAAGAMSHQLCDVTVKWCDVGLWINSTGALGVEGVQLDRFLAIGVRIGVYGDATGATYNPPVVDFTDCQFDVGYGATAGEQAVYLRGHAQVNMRGGVVYGHAVASAIPLLQFDFCPNGVIDGVHINDFAVSKQRIGIRLSGTSDGWTITGTTFVNLDKAIDITSTVTDVSIDDATCKFKAVNTRVVDATTKKARRSRCSDCGSTAAIASGTLVPFNFQFDIVPKPTIQEDNAAPTAGVTYTVGAVTATGFRIYFTGGGTRAFHWSAMEPS